MNLLGIHNQSTAVAAPAFVSAEVQASGRVLQVQYSASITSGLPSLGFTLTGTIIESGSYYSGLYLYLIIRPVTNAAVITIQYDDTVGDLAGVGGDVVSSGPTAVTNSSTFTESWALLGNSASFPGATGSSPSIKFNATSFNSNDIAIIDPNTDAARVSRYTAPNWGNVGTPYSISGLTVPAIENLDGTNFAVFKSNAPAGLFTLSWNGSTFTPVGNQLNMAGSNSGLNLCRLTNTRIVKFDSGNNYIQVYDWDGNDWASVGSSYPEFGSTNGNIRSCRLSDSTFAWIDTATSGYPIKIMSFDGANLSVVAGSEVDLFSTFGINSRDCCVCELNSTDVAIGGANGDIVTGRFSGGSWTTIGSIFTVPNVSSSGSTDLCFMGNNQVAFMRSSSSNSFLRRLIWQ